MCNCGGNVQLYSNCAGKPDCNCSKAAFNNMVGMNGFVNATGEIQPIKAPTVQVQTTIPTVKLPTSTTAPKQTASTDSSTGTTLNKALDLGTSLLGLFGKKTTTTSAPVPLPEEEKSIPMAVWIVVGSLLLLVVAFVIVKQAKK